MGAYLNGAQRLGLGVNALGAYARDQSNVIINKLDSSGMDNRRLDL